MSTAASDKRRVAWITGATSGIGRAVALRLVRDGYDIAASARRVEELNALVSEAPQHIRAFPLDVTDQAAVDVTVAEIETGMGEMDLALFCAGTYVRDSAAQFDSGLLASTVNLNLTGTAHCLEAVMAPMLKRRRGHIAVVSSVVGYSGLPGGAFYGATKAALINMCEALYPELDASGVRLQVISPGFVDTPLTKKNDFPMPFLISADQAADHIATGLRSRRFEIVFPWKMAVTMKFLQALPYPLRFAVTRRMLRK